MKKNLRPFAIFLVVMLALQVVFAFDGFSSELFQVYKNIGQSGLWRSAKFFKGTKFANYILFLNENIPDDAVVFLPPKELAPKALASTPVMQFYLSPRQIANCTDSACFEMSGVENTYILIVKNFPPLATELTDGDAVMFNDTWGVLRPSDTRGKIQPEFAGFGSLIEIIKAVLLPVIWLLVLTAVGALIIAGVTDDSSWIIRLSLGYGMGVMLYSLAIAFISLLDIKINTMAVVVITGVSLLCSLGYHVVTVRLKKTGDKVAAEATRTKTPIDKGHLLWGAFFVLLAGLAAIISVGKSFHATDSIMLWGAKGYGIAADESIRQITEWGTNTVAYPLHIPIMIGSFKTVFGEILPASKLLFSGYFLAFMFAIYALLQRIGVRRVIAGAAAAIFATTPFILRHATIAYANFGLTFYIVTAMLTAELSLHKSVPVSFRGYLLLSGLLFVGAAWTRPEGLILAWLGIAVVLMAQYANKRVWLPVKQFGVLVIPLVIYSICWVWFKSVVYATYPIKDNIISRAVRQILGGNYHFNEAAYILQSVVTHLFSPRIWGALGFMLIIIFGVMAAFAAFRLRKSLFWFGVLSVLGVTGIYYFLSFSGVHDVSWWVQTGLDRMMMPGIAALWFGLFGGELFDD